MLIMNQVLDDDQSMYTTEVAIKSPRQALTLLSEDGLKFVCRTLSEGVLASRTFDADLRTLHYV